MNMTENNFADSELAALHPPEPCQSCTEIDRNALSPEQVIDAVIADAAHWGVTEPEEKFGVFGAKGMLLANKVLTGKAFRGELPDVANPGGYYVSVAGRYASQIQELRHDDIDSRFRKSKHAKTSISDTGTRRQRNRTATTRRNGPAPRAD